MRRSLFITAASLLALTVACGGGDGWTETPVPTTVTVTPGAVTLSALGATQPPTAPVREPNGAWPALKGQVNLRWGKLTDDDLQRFSGTTAELARVLQQRYGYGKVQAEMEINQWVSRHNTMPIKF